MAMRRRSHPKRAGRREITVFALGSFANSGFEEGCYVAQATDSPYDRAREGNHVAGFLRRVRSAGPHPVRGPRGLRAVPVSRCTIDTRFKNAVLCACECDGSSQLPCPEVHLRRAGRCDVAGETLTAFQIRLGEGGHVGLRFRQLGVPNVARITPRTSNSRRCGPTPATPSCRSSRELAGRLPFGPENGAPTVRLRHDPHDCGRGRLGHH